MRCSSKLEATALMIWSVLGAEYGRVAMLFLQRARAGAVVAALSAFFQGYS